MTTSHQFSMAQSLLRNELLRRPPLRPHRRALTLAVFEALSFADVCDRVVAQALTADVIRAFEASL